MRLLIFLLFFAQSISAWAAITAQLDQDQVAAGETVQLTLQHDGQTDSQPDLAPLKQDFNIIGQSSGSSIQIINGKMKAQVQISLALSPKRAGKLQVPALQWDGQSSQALALSVGGNGGNGAQSLPSPSAGHVFLSSTLDAKNPYVQAAIPLTVRLYSDQPLYQASLDLQPGKDVLIQQLGQDKQVNETRDGKTYQVVERHYLLFAQRSGRIELDGAVLNAQVQDTRSGPFFGNVFGGNPFAGMMGSTRPIRIQGDQIALTVRPRPGSDKGHDWLPAQNVTLSETWQPDRGEIHAGDPLTRHLQLTATGLTAAQLPDLSQLLQLPAGLKAYPDQAKLVNDAQGNTVAGSRTQDIAIVASQPGHYEIPALHLYWWDTGSDVQKVLDLPARALDVLPGAGGVAISTTPDDTGNTTALNKQPEEKVAQPAAIASSDTRWKGISLALFLLWMGTMFAWWRGRRQKPVKPVSTETREAVIVPPDKAAASQAFRQACRDNDAQAARRHLLDWARAIWPQDAPAGLNALAQRLDDDTLKPLLSQLDRACYAGGSWQGGELRDRLKSLPVKPAPALSPKLASLYP